VASHAQHYVALLECESPALRGAGQPDRGRAQLQARRLLSTDLANVLAAFDCAVKLKEADQLLIFSRDLFGLLDLTSAYDQMRSCYAQLLESALQSSSPELEMRARFGLASALVPLGDISQARRMAYAAHALAAKLDNREALAVTSIGLA